MAAAGHRNTQDSARGEEEALRDADFLFLAINEREQIDLPEVRKCWEFFENEIRWKRKPSGEILFIVPDDGVLKNLPLRLKKYGYFLSDEIDDAAAYCEDALQTAAEAQAKATKEMPPVKEIKYTPAENAVQQIKFSVRAPSIKSFDK